MPIVLLDRDGVINHDSIEYIKSPEEWHPIPGSLAAIADLTKAGYGVFVVSNQSGIGRKYYDLAMLEKIHAKMIAMLAELGGEFTEILYCPHHPNDGCECRKPKPGLLLKIAEKYAVNWPEVYYVGDSLVDMQVATSMGCIPLLVLTGNGRETYAHYDDRKKIQNFPDLAAAIKFILSTQK